MKPGDKVTWKHSPRGGWGYVYRVDAVILSLGTTWAKIKVRKAGGEEVERRVKVSSLEPLNRTAESHSGDTR